MYSPRTPDSANTGSLGTRTRTSIRRLFRTKSTVENLATPQPADPVPKAPVSVIQSPPRMFRSQTFERPSSSRSTKSVRNIFSSAKHRISLRPSTLFKPKSASVPNDPPRHQTPDIMPRQYGAFSLDNRNMQPVQEQKQHAREQSYVASEYKHACHPPVPTTPLPAVPCTPPASSLSSSSPPPPTPAEQAKSPGAFSSKSLGLRSLDFEYNELCVNGLLPATPPTTTSDVTTLPLLGAESADCTAIDMSWIEQGPLVTPYIPAAEDQMVNMVDIRSLDKLDSAHETLLPSDAIPLACRNPSALNDRCPYYTLVSHCEPPVLLDVAALIGSLGSVSRISTYALKSSAADRQFVVNDIDELLRELGFADEFIQGADVESIDSDEYPPLGTDSDVFSLKEIDELIEQLGNADFAQIITANSPRAECRQISASVEPVDIVSIVCCLGSVETIVASSVPQIAAPVEPVDIMLMIRCLGCVEYVVASSVPQITAPVEPLDLEAVVGCLGCVEYVVANSVPRVVCPVEPVEPVDIAATVRCLGSVEYVVASSVPQVTAPAKSIDIDSTIRRLGRIERIIASSVPRIAIQPKPIDIASTIRRLGRVENIVSNSVPQICRSHEPELPSDVVTESIVFDSAMLIFNLGRIVEPDLLSRLPPAHVIGELGNVDNVVLSAMPAIPSKSIKQPLVSPDYTPADIISELGNVNGIIPVTPRSKPFDSAALVRRLGNANHALSLLVPKPLTLAIPDSPALYVPDIIAELGGVYSPDFMVHGMERVHKSSARAMAEATEIPDSFGFKYKKQFLPALSPAPTSSMARPMDVDEHLRQAHSRSVSCVSTDASDSIGNIARLITALRIPPIIVSRPFLGPLRNVLFSDLC
ncbi:hypothetical protein LPJ53_002125 [Coemansia erecta]|uniref:Uncharacterized protein n=1 Tax=Coemansia erecta TaxID=147472 RepID=A0A9W7XYS6_9FUNG|nr:hypothetical protein LPJ53_002125 [Coemansia erecta]